MFNRFLRPGQGFQWFDILERNGAVADNGRPLPESFTNVGQLPGILMAASLGDIQQWQSREERKQNTHRVLFKIVQPGNMPQAKNTDVLCLNGQRYFTIKGVHNPGDLNHYTVYFAEEREDLERASAVPLTAQEEVGI